MLGRNRPRERSSRRLARGARHIRTRVFTGHRQPHRVTNFLVGAARSLGVGRARASAHATSGPGKKVESRRDLIFYKRLQLLVDYVGERVKGVQTSSTIYRTTPVVDEYQTVSNFGLADSFNEFVHAMRSYHRQCTVLTWGGATVMVPFTATQCIVIASNGNLTVSVSEGRIRQFRIASESPSKSGEPHN